MNQVKRKYVLSFLALLVMSTAGLSQTANYKESMKKQVAAFNSAKGVAAFQKTAESFSSIAASEKKEWLPYYYAGLCNVLVAFEKPKTEIDAWCDKAEACAKKADSLSKNNSEVLVLKSMIAAARILVNEKTRAQKYGSQSTRYANEAIKINVNNPRAYLLKARNLLHTPVALGGGDKKAKPVLETALEKDKIFKAESNLHPVWGKDETEKELKKINGKKQ